MVATVPPSFFPVSFLFDFRRLPNNLDLERTNKRTLQMLHLWLHLKSDDWVKWRQAHERRGSSGAAGAPVVAGAEAAAVAAVAAAAAGTATTSPSPSAATHTPVPAGTPSAPQAQGTAASDATTPTPPRKTSFSGPSRGGRSGGVVKAGKRDTPSKGRAGGVSSRGAGGEERGGAAPAGVVPVAAAAVTAASSSGTGTGTGRNSGKCVRYRLEGEHDRFLADWEGPARKALKVRVCWACCE